MKELPFRITWLWQMFCVTALHLILVLPTTAQAATPMIAAGGNHTCASTTSGGLKCWGFNSSGQLGDNSDTNSLVPVDVSSLASGVAAISAGLEHTCVVTTLGGVKCWGANSKGQIGANLGTLSPTRVPIEVTGLASGVTAIAAGLFHTCVLTSVGGVKCWGANDRGQLGVNSTTPWQAPMDVVGLASGVTAIAAGGDFACAVTAAGGVKCWGANDKGQVGDGTLTDQLTPANVTGLASGVNTVSAEYYHTCALTTTGGVKCWGNNFPLMPAEVAGLSIGVIAIGAGYDHTCAITTAGGVKCWNATVPATPLDVPNLTSGVTAIAAGMHHYCVRTAAGGVKCWGLNYFGQLGDNSTIDRLLPVDVPGFAGVTLPRLINLSTRGQVQSGRNVMIGGFIISGTTPKKVLIRAVGPNLANYGVIGVLADPTLQLFAGSTAIATNNDWGSAANAADIQATGLAPANAKESAILTTLDPGAYTAIVSGVDGGTGVGMVEVYEIDHPEIPLINASTRGPVQTGGNVMIGGFIIQGDSPQTVLIRAVGPNLLNYGVTGVLADPMLELHRSSDGAIIASNDNWGTASNAAAIQATGLAPVSPLESAILITLPPGAYTAVVSGSGGGTGVGIVEVYPQ